MTDARNVSLDAHRHVVEFYEHDEDLVMAVAQDLAAGLNVGASAVVVATPDHADALGVALASRRVDVDGLLDVGRLIVRDAAETLTAFMVDGQPNPARFREAVGGLIEQASRIGSHVRIFGEMVALLWDEGNVTAALELEALWNDLSSDLEFALYCGYPISSMASNDSLTPVREVCRQHTRVLTPPSYANGRVPLRLPHVSSGHNGSERSQFFVPVPLTARAVRRFARQTLEAWGEFDVIAEVEVIVSELVSNAFLHAESPCRVSLSRRGSTLRISVQDADMADPERKRLVPDAVGGRGVAIVAALADSWGTDHVADGKIVWAELALRS